MINILNRTCRHISRRFADQSGLSLIEIMVSMMIFLAVSAGVAGTITSGLRTTVYTRLATMGKAQAQEQTEEMRALPFHVPYSADPDIGTTSDVDLLDRYYPNLSTPVITDGWGWQGWFTPASGTYTRKSPEDDHGIVRTVETHFINNDGSVIIPATFDTNSEGHDTPPSQLVEIRVTTSWADRTGDNSYTIVSRISSTNEYQGCYSNSNSHVDVISGLISISTGSGEPYASFLNGNFGEGHARVDTGCEVGTQAWGAAGEVVLTAGNTYLGAYASVTGPPNRMASDGPGTVGPTMEWPVTSINNTTAQAQTAVAESLGGLISAEGGVTVESMNEELQQVDGWPGATIEGYRQWDFSNPVIEAVGVAASEPSLASLQQLLDVTTGEGAVVIEQVNILPLVAKTAGVPSAPQGLIFVRGFTAEVISNANGREWGASNQVTYSATIGIFDPSSPADCVGDNCYDLFALAGPDNPIQTAINLASSNYRLQNELFTEFHSYTGGEISAASAASSDGTSATISVDALLKVTARFGTEVRWNTANDEITLVNPQGLEQVWLGAIDVALHQET